MSPAPEELPAPDELLPLEEVLPLDELLPPEEVLPPEELLLEEWLPLEEPLPDELLPLDDGLPPLLLDAAWCESEVVSTPQPSARSIAPSARDSGTLQLNRRSFFKAGLRIAVSRTPRRAFAALGRVIEPGRQVGGSIPVGLVATSTRPRARSATSVLEATTARRERRAGSSTRVATGTALPAARERAGLAAVITRLRSCAFEVSPAPDRGQTASSRRRAS